MVLFPVLVSELAHESEDGSLLGYPAAVLVALFSPDMGWGVAFATETIGGPATIVFVEVEVIPTSLPHTLSVALRKAIPMPTNAAHKGKQADTNTDEEAAHQRNCTNEATSRITKWADRLT